MKESLALIVAGLLASALAAPAPVADRVKRALAPNVPTQTPYGPPGSSGSLLGSESLAGYQSAASNDLPVDVSTDISTNNFQLAPGQSEPEDLGLYLDLSTVENPQPIRGSTNSPTDPGPQNVPLQRQNSDIFAPPGTDSGDTPQAKWPLALSHNRHGLNNAGWARQQNTDQLPAATAMAGVDMRLEPNAYRELHWHKANEWAYILNGTVRLNAMNEAGQTFTDDLGPGDVWFFPAGKPHSIQAFESGVEFLLVFDDGSFSEDNTFLVSELFERNPKSVLAKNLRVDTSALDKIPDGQLYIFNGTAPPANISSPLNNITGPAGNIPQTDAYSFHWSQQQPYEVPGGTVKILDPLTFPTASNFAVALFTIAPGAMRELHWHTTSDEWSFFIQGQARLTVFDAPTSSRTFDFQAGDVGYVPTPDAHYIENTGTEDVIYLEVLQAGVYNDISVAQWLGLTPKQIVKDHLGFSEDTLNRLPTVKPFILPGNKNLLTTNFTEEAE